MSLSKKKLQFYLYIFFLILVVIFSKFSTNYAFSKNYIVSNIEIEEFYDLNFEKTKVIDKAFKKAFKNLVFKLVQSKDQNIFKTIDIDKIKTLVDNFSITDEKFINNKYQSEFEVQFNRKKIIEYIHSKNIIPSIPSEIELLIIPILIDENSSDLFYFNQNIFYERWKKSKFENSLISYNLPSEDIEDYQEVKKYINNIVEYNFKEIINKYNFTKYIVFIAFKNNSELKIFSKINFDGQIFFINDKFENFNLKDEQNVDNLINKFQIIFEDKWKLINKINTSIVLTIKLKVDSKNYKLAEKLEKTLKNFALVSKFNIEQINSNEILYKIIFNGMPNKFVDEMKLYNFKIDNSKKIWLLK